MEELLHLLTNIPHWGFELITDMVFGGMGYLWVRFYHDMRHHGKHQEATQSKNKME